MTFRFETRGSLAVKLGSCDKLSGGHGVSELVNGRTLIFFPSLPVPLTEKKNSSIKNLVLFQFKFNVFFLSIKNRKTKSEEITLTNRNRHKCTMNQSEFEVGTW